jgi:hypothetical protein
MHRATALRLFLVALLLLSGCNAFSGGDNTTRQTVTPAAVPTNGPTQTPTTQLAPGLTQYGVVDPVALGAAHNAALSNTSYSYVKTVSETYANGTLRARRTIKARVVEPKRRFYSILDRGLPGVHNGRTAFVVQSSESGEPNHYAVQVSLSGITHCPGLRIYSYSCLVFPSACSLTVVVSPTSNATQLSLTRVASLIS